MCSSRARAAHVLVPVSKRVSQYEVGKKQKNTDSGREEILKVAGVLLKLKLPQDLSGRLLSDSITIRCDQV